MKSEVAFCGGCAINSEAACESLSVMFAGRLWYKLTELVNMRSSSWFGSDIGVDGELRISHSSDNLCTPVSELPPLKRVRVIVSRKTLTPEALDDSFRFVSVTTVI